MDKKVKNFILRKKAPKAESDTVKIPVKDFIKEHKKLINVLNSPSREDDKKEAKEQAAELKDETSKSGVSTVSMESEKLADKIEVHNKKKLHAFAKKIKKSLDFHNTTSAVSTQDQILAEKTTSPDLINYIKSMVHAIEDGVTKVRFEKGLLTLSQKEPGLFNGFFQDKQGQVIEKFDNQTVEIIAKNMEMKNLYIAPVAAPTPVPAHSKVEELEDRIIAQEEAMKLLSQHNSIYHQGQAPGEPIGGKRGYIRIKAGDFELELKKSVKAFVEDFRLAKSLNQDTVKKAIRSWRKKYEGLRQFNSDQSAAREILTSWPTYQEELSQIVCGLTAMENEKDGQE